MSVIGKSEINPRVRVDGRVGHSLLLWLTPLLYFLASRGIDLAPCWLQH